MAARHCSACCRLSLLGDPVTLLLLSRLPAYGAQQFSKALKNHFFSSRLLDGPAGHTNGHCPAAVLSCLLLDPFTGIVLLYDVETVHFNVSTGPLPWRVDFEDAGHSMSHFTQTSRCHFVPSTVTTTLVQHLWPALANQRADVSLNIAQPTNWMQRIQETANKEGPVVNINGRALVHIPVTNHVGCIRNLHHSPNVKQMKTNEPNTTIQHPASTGGATLRGTTWQGGILDCTIRAPAGSEVTSRAHSNATLSLPVLSKYTWLLLLPFGHAA